MGNESAKARHANLAQYCLLSSKKLERLKKLAHKQYPQLALQNPMLVADKTLPDCPVVLCNPEFLDLTLYTLDDVLGYNCRFLQGRHTDPETIRRLKIAIEAGERAEVEILNYRKDGVPFHNRFALLPVYDGSKPRYFISVLQDITTLMLDSQPQNWDAVQVAVYLETNGVQHGWLPFIQKQVRGDQFLKITPKALEAIGITDELLVTEVLAARDLLVHSGAKRALSGPRPFHRARVRKGPSSSDSDSDDGLLENDFAVLPRTGPGSDSSHEGEEEDKDDMHNTSVVRARKKAKRLKSCRELREEEEEEEDKDDMRKTHLVRARQKPKRRKTSCLKAAPLPSVCPSPSPRTHRSRGSLSSLMAPEGMEPRPIGVESIEIFMGDENRALFAEHYDELAAVYAVSLVRVANVEEYFEECERVSKSRCNCIVCPVSAEMRLDHPGTIGEALVEYFGSSKVQPFVRQLLNEHCGEVQLGSCHLLQIQPGMFAMFVVVCRSWRTPFYSYGMPYFTMRSVLLSLERYNKRGENCYSNISRVMIPALSPDVMLGMFTHRATHPSSLNTRMGTSDLRRALPPSSSPTGNSDAAMPSTVSSLRGKQVASQSALAINSLRNWKGFRRGSAKGLRVDEADLFANLNPVSLSNVVKEQEGRAAQDRFVELVVSGQVIPRGLATFRELELLTLMIAASDQFDCDYRVQHVASLAAASMLSELPPHSHLRADIAKTISLNRKALAQMIRLAETGRLQLCRAIDLDDLEKIKRIASGAAGEVYSAEWDEGSRTRSAAVKLMYPGDGALREFHREVAIMSLIVHPCLVTLFGSGEKNGQYFHVTEFAEKGSLFDHYVNPRSPAARNRPFPDVLRLRVLRDVAEGLAALHSVSVVHRDLKSMNVLLFGDRAKLADYGTSKMLDHDMTQGVGTTVWMAPEVLLGAHYCEKSDIYSMAMLMYEVLTRTTPFPDVSFTGQLIEKLHRDERPSWSGDVVGGNAMKKLVSKCWSTTPSKRPSAASLVTALEEIHCECK